jgi:serine/threonine protein phosphatase 1
MRYLAIGDIHGYADVLDRLLELVRPRPEDEIITVGDYVDRGPDSKGVLDRLIELNKTGQLTALRGNHDFMMLQARQGGPAYFEWLLCGGRTTLDSYGINWNAPDWSDGNLLDWVEPSIQDIPAAHWHFLEEVCVDWYEIDTHFFVHAQADPRLPFEDQPLYLLHWEALYEIDPHVSGKIMVCGHTKQKSGRPRNWGHAVCIDTWVYGEGWLTCLDVKSGKYWQANKHGEVREDRLEEPEERVDIWKES